MQVYYENLRWKKQVDMKPAGQPEQVLLIYFRK